jgi:hypothetical protein
VALALIGVTLVASARGFGDNNLREHHLAHTALYCGGGILGILAGSWVRARAGGDTIPERYAPLLIAVVLVAPIVAMALMIPTTSDWIEAHPLAHALEHLGLICLGGLIGYCGRLLSVATGWLAVFLLTAMAGLFSGMALP